MSDAQLVLIQPNFMFNEASNLCPLSLRVEKLNVTSLATSARVPLSAFKHHSQASHSLNNSSTLYFYFSISHRHDVAAGLVS